MLIKWSNIDIGVKYVDKGLKYR